MMRNKPAVSAHRLINRLATAAALFLLTTVPITPAPGQSDTFTVTGSVLDQTTGAPIVSARITLLDPSGDTLAANVFTDARGRYRLTAPAGVGTEDVSVPTRFEVTEVHPNPRSAGPITIRYRTPGNRLETPEIDLYDILGRRMPTSGIMASGLYFYRLRFEDGHTTDTKRFILIGGGHVSIQLEQVGTDLGRRADNLMAKGADAGRDVRIIVDKMGFLVIETTRTVVSGEENRFDFELQRESLARGRLVVAVRNTAGERLADVDVAVVDGDLAGRTNVLGETALDSVYTGNPIVLKLTKPGYMEQFVRTEVPSGFSRATAEAVLRPRAPAATLFSVHTGAAHTGSDGARIELPSEALVDANGNPVTGSVSLSMTPLDVTDDAQLAAFPGVFEGFDADDVQRPLLTLGVTEIILEQGGEKLNLTGGKTALIELPLYVRTDELGNPLREGDTVPLWLLDEGTGVWVYETDGTVVASAESPTGLALRGEVSHFSIFNCDISFSTYQTGITTRMTRDLCNAYNGTWSANDGTCEVSESVCVRMSGKLPEAYGTRQTSSAVYCGTRPDGETRVLKLQKTDLDRWLEPSPMAIDAQSVNGIKMTTLAPADIDLELTLETATTTLPGREGLYIGRWTGTVTGVADEEKELEVEITFEPLETGGNNELISVPADLSRAINEPGIVDTYRFDGQAQDFMQLDLCRLPGSGLEGTVILRETGGAALAFQPFGEACGILTAVLPRSDSYTIEVTASAGMPGGYNLSLRRVAAAHLDIVYVDSVTVSGAWHLYSLTLEEEQLLVIAAEAVEASDLGFNLYVVDDEGNIVINHQVLRGQGRAVTTQLGAGTYILFIIPRNNGTVDYWFVLRPIHEHVAELGTVYERTIDRSFAFDRYRFVLDEAQTIVVTSRPIDMDVFGMRTSVRDADGRELAGRSHNVERDLEVSLEAGTYFLEIVPARGQLGSYRFVIEGED